MMKKKKKLAFAKRNSIGYIIVGTMVVIMMLFCIIALTGAIAPVVLTIHAGNEPAMLTMPILIYCIFFDLILLEVLFLLFQPGAKSYIEDDEKAVPAENSKKKMSGQIIIGIVCGVLLLCSIIVGPNVCNVFTEQGVDSYVFFKTDSVAWEDVGFYEVEFTKESGLSLLIHVSKDKSIPLFGVDNFLNQPFMEKYTDQYGFAAHLRQKAEQNGKTFLIKKGISEESLSPYYEHTTYWEKIKELIQ